jgi:hypothetical protein
MDEIYQDLEMSGVEKDAGRPVMLTFPWYVKGVMQIFVTELLFLG